MPGWSAVRRGRTSKSMSLSRNACVRLQAEATQPLSDVHFASARAPFGSRLRSAASSPLRLRPDVLVQPEQIPRIVFRLQRGQPREVAAIGPRYAVGLVLRHEVHIDAACGVWSGRRKEFARPFDRGLLVAALA